MKNIFFFLVLVISADLFAQKTDSNSPPPPPLPPPPTQGDPGIKRPNPDTSCYEIEKKDTTWNPGCKLLQEPAKFPGGDGELFKFLARNIKYPQQAKETGLQGKVFLTFVVDKTGEVIDVLLHKGIHVPSSMNGKDLSEQEIAAYKTAAKAMEDEAIRVVTIMPKWSPGKQDGKAVKMRFMLPVSYKLG